MKRIDEEGPDALVQIREPVNKFPHFVRYAVQRLKTLCPTLGKVKIAQILCRAGLHLGATTVGRILKESPRSTPSQAHKVPLFGRRRVSAFRFWFSRISYDGIVDFAVVALAVLLGITPRLTHRRYQRRMEESETILSTVLAGQVRTQPSRCTSQNRYQVLGCACTWTKRRRTIPIDSETGGRRRPRSTHFFRSRDFIGYPITLDRSGVSFLLTLLHL